MKFLITILLLTPVLSFAKATPTHRTNQPAVHAADSFNVIINMGQKRAWYKIWQDKNGKFYAASNGGQPTVGVLSDQNFQFLNMHSRQVASMPAVSTITCQKSNMMLVKNGKVLRSACIGAKNKTTLKMTELAGLLAMLQ